VSMGVRLFPAVHGHIADSVRDHEPGPVAHSGGSLGAGKRKRAIPRTALPLDFDGSPSSVKNPPGSGKITGGSRVWPTHDPRDPRAVARTMLISAYRFGLTTPGSRPILPGRRMGCRRQRPATDKPASSWPAPVSAGLLLTWDVPAVDLSCTSRDGTDGHDRPTGPVTYAVLTTSRCRAKATFTPC
jgi:hypothetical protein